MTPEEYLALAREAHEKNGAILHGFFSSDASKALLVLESPDQKYRWYNDISFGGEFVQGYLHPQWFLLNQHPFNSSGALIQDVERYMDKYNEDRSMLHKMKEAML